MNVPSREGEGFKSGEPKGKLIIEGGAFTL